MRELLTFIGAPPPRHRQWCLPAEARSLVKSAVVGQQGAHPFADRTRLHDMGRRAFSAPDHNRRHRINVYISRYRQRNAHLADEARWLRPLSWGTGNSVLRRWVSPLSE